MKINKKIIVSSMALCMGAALAGSVSGTIAWYQYSTRSTVAMLGTSVGVARNMQIRIGSGTADDSNTEFKWGSDLRMKDVENYLNRKDSDGEYAEKCRGDLTPVTTGVLAKNGELPTNLYTNPVYQHFDLEDWGKADGSEYVVIPVFIRYVEDNKDGKEYLERDVYFHDVTIASANASNSNKLDISKAVRLNASSQYDSNNKKNANFSVDGEKINTFGKLDLNGDGYADGAEHYEWEMTETDPEDSTKLIPTAVNYGTQIKTVATDSEPEVLYTDDETNQTCYKASNNNVSSVSNEDKVIYAEDDNDPYHIAAGKEAIAKTNDDGTGVEITLTIWLEGWQKLSNGANPAEEKTIWDVANYADSKFNVGVTFTCEL